MVEDPEPGVAGEAAVDERLALGGGAQLEAAAPPVDRRQPAAAALLGDRAGGAGLVATAADPPREGQAVAEPVVEAGRGFAHVEVVDRVAGVELADRLAPLAEADDEAAGTSERRAQPGLQALAQVLDPGRPDRHAVDHQALVVEPLDDPGDVRQARHLP